MVQNAVLGNTAFVVGVEVVTRTDSVDILVTTRNNATFDRTPSRFWPGNTQAFVELLMLEDAPAGAADAAVPLADPGEVTFMHEVWPKKVAYEAFTDAAGALLTGSLGLATHLSPEDRACQNQVRHFWSILHGAHLVRRRRPLCTWDRNLRSCAEACCSAFEGDNGPSVSHV